MLKKHVRQCFIHVILYDSTYVIKTLSKNIFISPFRNIYKMLHNIPYTHFFRNLQKTKINQFKMFRKCFVLPGYTTLPHIFLSELKNIYGKIESYVTQTGYKAKSSI